MDLKDRLREKRQAAGWTQQELANILHVSRQTVSSWEVGRTYPDLEMLLVLSELYETPLDDLLKEDSQIVEDITQKVKKSERRKVRNIILAALLILTISLAAVSGFRGIENTQVNAEGLSPDDLLDSAWELHLDPSQTLFLSHLSFGTRDIVILNQYSDRLIKPDTDLAEAKKKLKEQQEKGLADGIHTYQDLKIKTESGKYIVTAYGYHQEFTKLSSRLIRDSDGKEYRKVSEKNLHAQLFELAERMKLNEN